MKKMLERGKSGVLLMGALCVVGSTGCYDTYVIDKDELRKLESSVDQREVVEVYGDCVGGVAVDPAPAGEAAPGEGASRYRVLHGSMWAQAEPAAPGVGDTATDATSAAPSVVGRPGCETVPVSTGNNIKVVTNDGDSYRVTPFNFIMSDSQLVSPEYDLLLSLNDVQEAEVKRFSTWKTVATISTMTVVTVGIFTAIALLAPPAEGFN